ncbi:hypothetical protein CHS0354_042613 [Potamilus streckersoni]|uniref:Uncharacterized protein n=1 Tax=Potamilus streckersoni TaxID=2493646 RepID=A0AAE0TDX8_9BIVA|nr:hypothetical protein CHS0354_042613 [Potamilus streckersoni]
MRACSKIRKMTTSPSVKRELKSDTVKENERSTAEVFDKIMKTPKSKSRAEVVTPLRDDFMCSQQFDSQADVCWDCTSPDTLRHIQKISNRDGMSSDLDNILKLIIEEEPNQQVRDSESPPLLGVWKHRRDMELGKQQKQQRRREKRRMRMRHQSASDALISRELLQKLTLALQKCQDSQPQPVCDEMDSKTCARLPISDDPTSEELGKADNCSHDLFDSVMVQKTVADDKIEKPKPEQKVVTLTETYWSDDELFEDDSFIIKATQYPQDNQEIAGSPVFVCNKRKLSEEGNVGNIKNPRYVAHASSHLVLQDSKLDLIHSKNIQNQQVKNVVNKPPNGKSVSITGQKNHVFSSKPQIGVGTNTVINDICKSSDSLSKKDRNIGYGKGVPGQGPSNINHGSMQNMQSSVYCPTNTQYSYSKVNSSDLSGVNNPCAVRANSASPLKVNTGSLFRKHSSFPGQEMVGGNTNQQCSGTARQRLVMGTDQNSLSGTKESHYCNSKSSLMKRAHSLDTTFNTSNSAGTVHKSESNSAGTVHKSESNSAGTVHKSETGGASFQYGYKPIHPISCKKNSGVNDKHSGHSRSIGRAKKGNVQKNQMQNKNTRMTLDYYIVSTKCDSQKNPPSNKENWSKEYEKNPDLKLVKETADTNRRQSLDTSLTDELLCQFAEPDESLESQIYQVNKYKSASVDTDIVLPKAKNMNFQNFGKLKASSSHNALKSDSTKVYSFKPTQQASCMKKQQGQSNSSASEKKPSEAKKGLVPVTDSEDLFFSDDDAILMEPQTLAMLDKAERMATQQSETDYSKIKKGNSSEYNNKDPKNQLAGRHQLRGSQERPQDCSQQVASSQITSSGSQMQCTPEEIEKKRIEAIRRRQERAAKKTSLSLRKR